MNAALLQVLRAVALIERHLFDGPPLADLTRIVSCSPCYLHQLFAADEQSHAQH